LALVVREGTTFSKNANKRKIVCTSLKCLTPSTSLLDGKDKLINLPEQKR